MSPGLLAGKLDLLQQCLERIESKVPFTLQRLQADPDLQDVIALNLQRATQCCIDLAYRMIAETRGASASSPADVFAQLQFAGIITAEVAEAMKKSVGMRNVMVHEYSKLDWAILHEVCHGKLGNFKAFGGQIMKANAK